VSILDLSENTSFSDRAYLVLALPNHWMGANEYERP
jgi:hypothetical protein